MALAVGLFFGAYPANRAAALRPIDALALRLTIPGATMTTTAPAPAPAEDDPALDGGDALEAPLPPIKHRRKLGPLTFVLALVFVAAAGFLLGVGAEHRHDADNPPDNPLAALLAGRGAAGAQPARGRAVRQARPVALAGVAAGAAGAHRPKARPARSSWSTATSSTSNRAMAPWSST